MALNLDAAMRVIAKVQGLNEFKALADGLGNVKAASNESRTGLQQLSAESSRLTQEAAKTAGSVKAQTSALQDLQTRTRAGASETRRMAEETRNLGSATTQLRGQSTGAVDGLAASLAKGASSLRNLQQALQPTDEALSRLRQEVLAYGAANKQTERSLEQQVQALKNLRSQAEINGDLYNELTNDMQRLSAASKGLGDSALFGVEGLKKLGAAGQTSSQSIEQQIKSLTRLQSTLAKGGDGYRAIGKEIDSLKAKAASLDLSKGLNVPATVLGSTASGVSGAIANIVKLRQELAKTNTGRVVLTGEGLGVASAVGAAGAGAASGLGSVAAGLGGASAGLDAFAAKAQALPGLLKPLGNLAAGPIADAAAGIAKWGTQLGAAQAKLSALAAPFEAIGTAVSAIGPEAAAAAGAASLAIASVYGVLSRQADKAQADAEAAFKGISDDAQTALQNLVRLYDKLPSARLAAQERLRDTNLRRLGESEPGSVEARMNANAVAVAEREISKIKTEQNQLLEQARDRLNAGAEAIKRQTQAARERLEVQRQITAAVKAEQAQYADDRAVRGAIRRNQERLERDRARMEREQANLRSRAAEAFPPSAVLALPAAGQTSFRGTMRPDGTGGGALTSLDNIEIAGTRSNVGAAMGGFSPQARAALNEQAEATEKARGALSRLFIEIDKVEAASNGSVNSLQRQRAAWEALRVAVNPAAPAYEKARAKVQQLDEQLKKLTVTQEKASRSRGIGREAVGGALGALATGGGPQAALGSLAGSLAFSGSAAGLAVGAGLTAVGGLGALATRTGLDAESAQVRLKALTDQFGEYNEAQAAAANIARTLRISTTEAQGSFANLYASLRPTGIGVKELEAAYIGFSAAARNSGATAQETSNALIQLKQGLASGTLQGEELRSIREQAPLAAQAIARELGVTIGELKGLAAEGKVTTDVVLRALGKLQDTQLGKLNAQFNTGEQAIKDFQIALDGVGKSLARIFGPAALAGLRAVTGLLQRTADLLNGDLAEKIGLMQQARDRAGQEAMAQFSLTERFTRMGEYQEFNRRRSEEIYQQLLAQREARLAGEDKPNADQLRARQEAERERLAAQQRQAREAAQERLEEELKIRQDAEKRLADAAQQREEQLRDFRLETIKRAQDLERQLGDQRRQIERDIEANRRKAAQYDEDIATERAIREQRAQGFSTDGLEAARRVNELFRQFEEQKIANQDSALDRQTALQRQLEEFKITTADGVGKIQEAYAKAVNAILVDAGEKLAAKMQEGAQNAAATLSSAPIGGGGGSGATIASIADTNLNANARAWLSAIRFAEGTAGPNGYRTMFGGGLFSDMSRHPDRVIRANGYASAAAGAYQFMPDTWRMVGGGAMTPERQDRAALALAMRRGVDLSTALFTPENVAKLAPEWASLPTLAGRSYYGQPVKSFRSLQGVFGTAIGAPSAPVLPGPGSARQLIGGDAGSQAVAAARRQAEAAGAALKSTIEQAKNSANDSAFKGVLASIEADLTGITSELDQQRRSSREKLEDEKLYDTLLRQGVTPEVAQQRVELERIATNERARLEPLRDRLLAEMESNKLTDDQKLKLQEIVGVIDDRIASQGESIAKTEEEIQETKRLKKAREDAEGRDIGKGFKDGVQSYLEEMGTLAESTAAITGKALKGLEDQLVNFVTTGKANFKELAASILSDMARIALQQLVLKPILTALFPTPSANGNVFGPAGLVPYAAGGIVNRPTIFPFADGAGFRAGIMGEAGPEAILPLRRGPDGKLGVVNTGGSSSRSSSPVTVNVSVDATGSSVQGNAGQGEQLGRAISQAVQAELIKQKRPGGLLAA